MTGLDEAERFWSHVDKHGGFADFSDPLVRVTEADGECWIWTASFYNGYGRFKSSALGMVTNAHRFAYFLEYAIWSTQQEPIDHLCRRPACVRHLEQVEFAVNVVDRGAGPTAVNAAKKVCIHGHEFTPENTMPHGNGRKCRECHRRITREWAQKNRANRRTAA